ncbi:conserved hypothetical protein [Perkinsus marinus ATCC 50983]|uniref:Uncharacterized protein n=1 Tax=Perkinsus marinus (strain ATCC 50983 / TXsc) TaxID=423536 RepID=C5L3S2_PERM5|nr:conserved hypothetical protein [Perkinsus marinus ATCC 50983]EER08651.1 conserved hypothetical protein [Perkinsus marinus ATCC 50983]|eukprot:XP_002776835.1 conserved hypothetical protein [Perkinsus marinus ATCC 50983]
MLGELMENRKRAEESEQFFLTRMQQEATSFQHLVQMFEDSLHKVSADLDSRLVGFIRGEDVKAMLEEKTGKLEERLSGIEAKVDLKAHESTARIACLEAVVAGLQKEISKMKEEHQEEMEAMGKRIEVVSTSTKSEVSRTEAALSGRVDGVEEKFGKELHEVQEEMQKGFSTVNGERLDVIDHSMTELSTRMDAFDSKIDAVDNCIISMQGKHKKSREEDDTKHAQLETAFKELDGKMTGEFTSIGEKISELEKRITEKASSESIRQLCEGTVTEKVAAVTAQMDARFETVSKQMVDFQKVCDEQNEEFTKEHEELKNQLNKVHEVAKSAGIERDQQGAKLELKLQHTMDGLTKRVQVLEPRMDELQRDIQMKLSLISRKLRHLSHSGLNHSWRIDDAMNKIGALGVSAGRFIDSSPFALGAYKNMQLRLFPKGCGHGPPGAASNVVSEKSARCSVWLVWNPQASNREARLPPIRVELAVGKSRKGPLEMGHHESLYGCYVWQGNDICVLEDELTPSGSLEVSVSIPYRQWYDALELTPDEAEFEKDQLQNTVPRATFAPRGPPGGNEVIGSSRMSVASSAFTFGPDGPPMGNSTALSAPMMRSPETSNPFEQTLPTLAEVEPSMRIRPSSATQLRSFSPTPTFSDGEATVTNRSDRVRPQTMNLSATRHNPFSTTSSDLEAPTVPNSPAALASSQPTTRQRDSVPASFSHPIGRTSDTISPRRSNWTQFAG